MKQTIIIVWVVLTFLKINTTYGWDTTAAKFYPLSIGNYYVFKHEHLIISCSYVNYVNYYAVEIVSDTIFPNDKKYFTFESGWWFSDWKYQRVDSNSMNVYSYNIYTSEEELLDSLFANKGDTFSGKRNPFGVDSCIVEDTTSQYLLNANRLIKEINSGGSISMYYSLVEGLGFYGYSDCELGTGDIFTLKGCIINGVLYGDTSLTSIYSTSNKIPSEYKLYQNYPNPFNPSTKIIMEIAKLSDVKLAVYDVVGQEITTLMDKQLRPDTYEIEWNGSHYPSGVYFYRLVTEDYSETKKMLLIK